MINKPKDTRSILSESNKIYQEIISSLNAAQSEAVEQIDGPVMVIAGPGTGKTHILAARIGRILRDTDTQAHNILCLTFTDAGVQAMRERLLSFIGPEAHRIHIFTFHSFCNKIIQDNLDYFGSHDLQPINELERVDIIRRLLDSLSFNHPLKKGKSNPYHYEQHLYNLFQNMKREDWNSDYVLQRIEDYLASLHGRKEFIYQRKSGDNNKGDIKQLEVEKAKEKMALLSHAAKLYPAYLKAMEQGKYYDFEDMILWVIRAFEKNTNLLRNYQEQYLYFLVDEYQDTNGAQNHILKLLIEYWQNPNIFIVGDDDQSIFEFQGARLKNLTDFYQKFVNELKLIILTDNYRSTQAVLDTASALIANNQKRVINELSGKGVSKDLQATNELRQASKFKPNIIEYPNIIHEISDIVHQIEQRWHSGYPLYEIAIICAKHKQYESILTLLEKKGIPYSTKRRLNILDLPIILNLRDLMEYIHLEFTEPYKGEYLLLKIMHFDFWNLPPNDLAKIAYYLKTENNKNENWRNIIGNASILLEIGINAPDNFLKFSEFIELMIGNYINFSLPTLIERMLNRSGLLHQLQSRPDKLIQIQILNTFFEFIKIETFKNPRFNIKILLEMLKRMDDNRLKIEINKNNYASLGVNLLTAHAAKGLEFACVFMPDCTKEQWEKNSDKNQGQFALPDTLTLSGEEDAIEARRRLFYVGITRAKEELYISSSKTNYNGKPFEKTAFIDEILNHNSNIEVIEKSTTDDIINDIQWLNLRETAENSIQPLEKEMIDALLKDFSMSVSALNRYLACPLSFYFENVLRIPSTSSEAAAYGTAMHHALRMVFEKMLRSKQKEFPTAKQFVSYFEMEMQRQQGYFNATEYKNRLEQGRTHLQTLYEQQVNIWHKNTKLEVDYRNVEIDGVPINGILDKVDYLDNNNVHIIDYKTGKIDDKNTAAPTEKNPIGGKYWRQLVFYKILFENHRNNIAFNAKSAEIKYLEPDDNKKFKNVFIHFEPEQVTLMRTIIKDTYQKIRNHNFYSGCGEKNCTWCNFVKKQMHLDVWRNNEIEELDDLK